MGITKGQLKSIVKECLIEILSEGMGASTGESINEAKKKVSQKQILSSHAALRQNASKIKMQTAAINEAIKREAGGDNVMASILADTAANTLQTMLENDSPRSSYMPPTGTVERLVASHAPEDLFGEEAASKWANLAFMGNTTK